MKVQIMPTAERYDELAAEGGRHAKLFADMAQWVREQETPLTDKERQVVAMLRDGKSREDMAFLFGVSTVSVSKYFRSIWLKLDVRRGSDSALVYQLAARGWLV
jgi:DNA-binding NarL/FixJ family response regulator